MDKKERIEMDILIETEEIDNLEQPSSSIRNSKNDNNKERRISNPMSCLKDRPNEEDILSVELVSTKTNKCPEESVDTDKSLTSNFTINQVETDEEDEQLNELYCYTPLKGKEYTNCLKTGESLIWYFEKMICNNTKDLLKEMQETDIVPAKIKVNSRLRNRIYIWACHRSFLDILHTLEELGVDMNYIERLAGMNAVLAASLSGNISCLEHLIGKGADVNSRNPINNYTPLHFAAIAKSREKTVLLLNNGAKLNTCSSGRIIEPVIHCAIKAGAIDVVKELLERGASIVEKDHLGETSLHVACFLQFIPCVKLLLSVPDYNINDVDRKGRTPLHFAVASRDCPELLVKLLLERGALVNAADEIGFTPLYVAALRNNSDCANTLIWAGADVSAATKRGISALKMILRKIPESLQVLRKRLDASIRLSRTVPHNRKSEMKFNFDPLFPSEDRCETSLIDIFVQENQKDLLFHPLVMAYLHVKLKKIRKICCYVFIASTMVAILLTTYVLTAVSYKCYNHDVSSSSNCFSGRVYDFLFERTVIEYEWYILFGINLITVYRKIRNYKRCTSVNLYFSNIDNVLDDIVAVSIFLTSFVFTGKTYDWQNCVGAFAILCAWTRVMLMVGKFTDFGIYIAMFIHIQIEFAKLLLAYSGLLIGFTVSFCAICVGKPAFDNIFTGFIKVLAMMTGELDFESFINEKDEDDDGPFVLNHPISVCAQILLALFIFFVTVILMNLLVGIAVHDINDLRNQSELTKLKRQIKLILYLEREYNPKRASKYANFWADTNGIFLKRSANVFVVDPLNPSEKLLPNSILQAALEIAENNMQYINDDENNLSGYVSCMEEQSEKSSEAGLKYTIEELSARLIATEEAIKSLKTQLLHISNML